MPTVFRHHGFRFFFFSNENQEPMHIHVESGEGYCKFWIGPIFLAETYNFNSTDLKKIRSIIESNLDLIRNSWNEHFSQNS